MDRSALVAATLLVGITGCKPGAGMHIDWVGLRHRHDTATTLQPAFVCDGYRGDAPPYQAIAAAKFDGTNEYLRLAATGAELYWLRDDWTHVFVEGVDLARAGAPDAVVRIADRAALGAPGDERLPLSFFDGAMAADGARVFWIDGRSDGMVRLPGVHGPAGAGERVWQSTAAMGSPPHLATDGRRLVRATREEVYVAATDAPDRWREILRDRTQVITDVALCGESVLVLGEEGVARTPTARVTLVPLSGAPPSWSYAHTGRAHKPRCDDGRVVWMTIDGAPEEVLVMSYTPATGALREVVRSRARLSDIQLARGAILFSQVEGATSMVASIAPEPGATPRVLVELPGASVHEFVSDGSAVLWAGVACRAAPGGQAAAGVFRTSIAERTRERRDGR